MRLINAMPAPAAAGSGTTVTEALRSSLPRRDDIDGVDVVKRVPTNDDEGSQKLMLTTPPIPS
jgi:hypothetical protein